MGALRAYTAIATTLFPGVTTVTTRVRYLSWLCAGLRLLDQLPDAPRGAHVGRERRKRLLPWERIIALATGYHARSKRLGEDAPAWRQLRGISYVRDAVERGVRTPVYQLLERQIQVGGVGTYWVALVAGGLVDEATSSLTERGEKLADEFLRAAPDHDRLRKVLAGADPSFDVDTLVSWGPSASLATEHASTKERRLLAEAVLESSTHRRVGAALSKCAAKASSDSSFRSLGAALRTRDTVESISLAAVTEATCSFEALHNTLLAVFGTLQAAGRGGVPVEIPDRWSDGVDVGRAHARLGADLDALRHQLPRGVEGALTDFLRATSETANATSHRATALALLRHHEHVQAGKLDAGRQPKRPWIELQGNRIVIAPRFALPAAPAFSEGTFTHPYRVEQFAGMMSEVGGWEVIS